MYIPLHLAMRSETGNASSAAGSFLQDCYIEAFPPDASTPVGLVSAAGVSRVLAELDFPDADSILAMAVLPVWDMETGQYRRQKGRHRLLVVAGNGRIAAPEIVERAGRLALPCDPPLDLGDPTEGMEWTRAGLTANPGRKAYPLFAVKEGEVYENSGDPFGVNFYAAPLPGETAPSYVGDEGVVQSMFTVPAGATLAGINTLPDSIPVVARQCVYPEHTLSDAPEYARIAHNGRDAFIATDDAIVLFEGARDNAGAVFSLFTADANPASPSPWVDVAWLDSYFLWATADGRWGHSLLNEHNFDASFFAGAEADPDPIVGMVSYRRRLHIFGTRSLEVWVNTGGDDFAFAREQGLTHHVGAKSRDAIWVDEEGLYFIGNDDRVYQMMGNRPVDISTPAVEYDLARSTAARGFVYDEEGHKFSVITLTAASARFPHPGFPEQAHSKSRCWCYDTATQLWSNRSLDWVRTKVTLFGRNLVAGTAASALETVHMAPPADPAAVTGSEIWALSRETPCYRSGGCATAVIVGPRIQAYRDLTTLHSVQCDLNIQGTPAPDASELCLSWRDEANGSFIPGTWGRGIPINNIRYKYSALGSFRQRWLRFCLAFGTEWVINGLYCEAGAFQEGVTTARPQGTG